MAVIVNPNDPNNPQNQAQTGPNGQPLQTVGTAAPSGQGQGGTPMARSQANSLAQQQRQGSGRFTNLQKYIQANQGAGQRIAGQVGQGMQKQFQQGQEAAQKYYGQLGQNIQQANQAAQQGAGFQQQLGQIRQQIQAATVTPEQLQNQQLAQQRLNERSQQDLSQIEAFTQSPDFQRFQDIQAGRAIDESLLALQQQRALTAAQQAAQGSQAAQQALGTESGRFDLLRKAFGGDIRSGYTQGQQRLDQVLFGQGSGLQDLQAKAAQQAAADLAQQQQAAAAGGDVGRIVAQEQGLIQDINTQAGKNEQAYLEMLASYANPLNQQRQQEFENLGQALGTYIPTYDAKTKKYKTQNYQPGFSEEQLTGLGLNANQGVYNVFKDEAFLQGAKIEDEAQRRQTLANIIASQGQKARTIEDSGVVGAAQDVAQAPDVTRYAALAKIMGLNPEQQRITQESNIGSAWTAKSGKVGEPDTGLKERIAAAEEAFYAKDPFSVKKTQTDYDTRMYRPITYGSGNTYYDDAGRANISAQAMANAELKDLIARGRGALDDTFSGYGTDYGVISPASSGRGWSHGYWQGPQNEQELNRATANYLRQYGNYATDWSGRKTMEDVLNNMRSSVEKQANQAVVDQFRKYIEAQNYGQTLGGRRTTFLDQEGPGGQALPTGPIKQTAPITGPDAVMQEYLQNLAQTGSTTGGKKMF